MEDVESPAADRSYEFEAGRVEAPACAGEKIGNRFCPGPLLSFKNIDVCSNMNIQNERMILLDKAEQKRQKDLERLRSFGPMDDDFMRCLCKDNIPLAAFVLRIITGKSDLVITDCQVQEDVKRLAGARSI